MFILYIFLLQVYCQNGVNKWTTYVTTYHGSTTGNDDGGYGFAQFGFEAGDGIAFDKNGNTYVASRTFANVRRITPDGMSTIISTGLNAPMGLAVDDANQVWISVLGAHVIKMYKDGVTSDVIGSGTGGYNDGAGTAAQLNGPAHIVLDGKGTAYITECSANRIRKVDLRTMTTSTFAGSTTGLSGSDDGVGTAARFNCPYAAALDSKSNLFVADPYNNRIRKITPDGTVTTFAGGSASYKDGQGTAALFNFPISIAIGKDDYMYVADLNNHVIRMISPDGFVSTIAGLPNSAGAVDGVYGVAKFNKPCYITIDGDDNLYVGNAVTDIINKVYLRRNNLMPMVSYANGGGTGAVDGVLAKASFTLGTSFLRFDPLGRLFIGELTSGRLRMMDNGVVTTVLSGLGSVVGIEFDNAGNIYFSGGTSHGIIRISSSLQVTTLAGGGGAAYLDNAVGTSARFNNTSAMKFDGKDSLFIAEYSNHCIRKMNITSPFAVSTFAGTCTSSGYVNGNLATAKFRNPASITADSKGNFFVADFGNHAIRIITSFGQVRTFAGRAPSGGVGLAGFRDGIGAMALFNNPYDLTIDKFDNLYVTDFNNHRIRMITPEGFVTTIAGTGTAGTTTGHAPTKACLNSPFSIAVSPQGELFSIQRFDDYIRKISLNHNIPRTQVSWIAGNGTGSADGSISTATFTFTWTFSLDLDSQGNIYVPDQANNKVRLISSSGVVSSLISSGCLQPRDAKIDKNGILWVACFGSNQVKRYTLAGTLINTIGSGTAGNTDGTLTTGQFNGPCSLAFDSKGNVFVAVEVTSNIKRIDSTTFDITTFAGTGTAGSTDGKGTGASFGNQRNIAIDNNDNLYITESNYCLVRKITPDGYVTTIAGQVNVCGNTDGPGRTAKLSYPSGIAIDNLGYIYVADRSNRLIRVITPNYDVFTLAGTLSTAGTVNDIGPISQFNIPNGLRYWNGSLYVLNQGSYVIQKITLERDWYISRQRTTSPYSQGSSMSPFSSINQVIPYVNTGDRVVISDPSTLNGNPASQLNLNDYICNPSQLRAAVAMSSFRTTPLKSLRSNTSLVFFSRTRNREQNSLSVWSAMSYNTATTTSSMALIECECNDPDGCGNRQPSQKPTVNYCTQKLNGTCVCSLPTVNVTIDSLGYARGIENGVSCVIPKKTDFPIYHVVDASKRYCTHKLNGACVCIERNSKYSTVDANQYEWLYENGSQCIVPKPTDSPYQVELSTVGLNLYLDAKNPLSYPGTGLIFYDLSTSKNNFTLPSSALTWQSSGYFTVGYNGIAQGPNSDAFKISIEHTVIVVARSAAAGNALLYFYASAAAGSHRMMLVHLPWSDGIIHYDTLWCSGNQRRVSYTPSSPYVLKHYVFRTKTNSQQIFENNVLKASGTATLSSCAWGGGSYLWGGEGNIMSWQGDFYTMMIYNRSLTDEEITLNYVYMKERYNIP